MLFISIHCCSYDDIENISIQLKSKYKVSLELCNEMTARLPNKRPDCEKYLRKRIHEL